ncbi:Homoserine/homoserine lactone efflux protein [Pseudoalteromonas sp. CIP111854]|uniref:Homoserine/homoserine lactone efflux protein n=1 Tax=Pseudoalteromonas holothuriae TaxID=2963714 RepID=A0A9W4W6I3_9GAMM|nr:LysE family translocator [Pseudoalteromonas sp. CIP111854]CAH9063982.1 Homoserine/homoserine lactone efflux protein [Pseudoalteromonas sp. CIP111854]
MSLSTLLLFIPACFALNLAPGPNNLLAFNNAQRYGFSSAIVGGFGRLLAFVIMITLAASGLAVVLLTSQWLFFAIKLLGAGYLFWLAIKLWRAPVHTALSSQFLQASKFQLAKQECLLALGNPKAILIFTAFLPQFIEPSKAVGEQFVQLGGLFLLLELIAVSMYAAMGAFLQNWFKRTSVMQYFNRGCATLIAALGIGMLLDAKTR